MTHFVFPLLFAACGGSLHTAAFDPPAAGAADLDAPGPVAHEAVLSARWAVPRQGLIDLTDPRAADLEKGDMPIVLPVHVLTHPTAGVFIVDTGVPRGDSPARGLVGVFLKEIEPVEPLAAILERQASPLAGVLLTHNHADHVLGLVDVPAGVPVYVGEGDQAPANMTGRLMFPTFTRALGERELTLWDFDAPQAIELDGIRALDIVGDGSIYALQATGHTPGSTAYLARTPDGPVLFTGDCSHTRWGWEHGVPPGTYTVDHDANAASLEALIDLAAAHPGMTVHVGHEL